MGEEESVATGVEEQPREVMPVPIQGRKEFVKGHSFAEAQADGYSFARGRLRSILILARTTHAAIKET